MRIKARIERMEKNLIPKDTVIRFADPDGTYPEAGKDKGRGNKVIRIVMNGIKGEQLKRWAR